MSIAHDGGSLPIHPNVWDRPLTQPPCMTGTVQPNSVTCMMNTMSEHTHQCLFDDQTAAEIVSSCTSNWT